MARRRTVKISPEQLEVLRWIGDGCPERDWPNDSHKIRAHALSRRGLALVFRQRGEFAAKITATGRYFLEHGVLPPRPSRSRPPPAPPPEAHHHQADEPGLDTAARAIRRLARWGKPSVIKHTKREVQEAYMRYKVAERFFRAASEEEAGAKAQEELDRPYGYFGTWKIVATDLDIVEAEQTVVLTPGPLSNEGTLLSNVKDAAAALGINPSTMYQLIGQGDIEWVAIGTRKYVSRACLLEFIKENSHKGYFAG